MAEDLLAGIVGNGNGSGGAGEMEAYHNTGNGNGDRFVDMWGDGVRIFVPGGNKKPAYYSLGDDGLWSVSSGRGAGAVEQKARAVVGAMRARAGALALEAAAAEDEKAAAVAVALGKWAHSSDNPAGLSTMMYAGCTQHGKTCVPQDFNQEVRLLGMPDGQVLELDEVGHVSERDMTSSDMITYRTAVKWRPELVDPAAWPGLAKQYVETFFPEEKKFVLLMKALGAGLVGGNPHRLLLILQGASGTNGKTQLVECLRKALGDYGATGNPSIFRGNLEEKPRPDLMDMMDKRFAFLAEASKSWELHGDRVKLLTGGDGLKVRQLYGEYEEPVPQFMPVIYTNEMPRVAGADKALRRRMIVVDFPHSPAKEDPTIKSRFMASQDVREWLFAMLVAGWQATVRDGLDDVVSTFALESEQGFAATTHLGEFFEWLESSSQLGEINAEDWEMHGVKGKAVLMAAMHERYAYWVKQHGNVQDGKDKLNFREFNKQLKDTYGWVPVKSNGARWERKTLTVLAS